MREKSTRNTNLRAWMVKHDIAQRTIAEMMGITRQRVGRCLFAESITAGMAEKFMAVGIPLRLLPPVKEAKRGPRMRTGRPCPHDATSADSAIAS